ncbi:MAG: LysR family transcriptional regulator [Acidobacteria bacterium]|nr:LysR family transcriptional regulator [Acidobacteriota bacterium]
MLDARRLLLLAEVDRCGSIAAAAEALSYTPSAISQQISRLEREIGQAVLERHPRHTVLTEVGRRLVAHAERVRLELEAASAELLDLERLQSGTVNVGAFPSATLLLLPPIVRSFRCQNPSVRLCVHSAQSKDLAHQLNRGDIDVAVMSDYDLSRISTANFYVTVLARDPMRVLLPRTHPLAHRGPVSLRDLRDERWIVRTDHPTTVGLFHACDEAGFEPTVSLEASERLDLQAMVAMGLGIAAAPGLSLGELLPDIAVVDVADAFPERRIFLAYLRRRRLSAPAHHFVKAVGVGAKAWPSGVCHSVESALSGSSATVAV